MIEVDPDQNLSDIRDTVREYQGEVPELQEVKISANKDELIEQVNQALEDYVDRLADADGEEIVFEADTAFEITAENAEIAGWSLAEDGSGEIASGEMDFSGEAASRDEEFDVDEDKGAAEDEEDDEEDDGKPGKAKGSPTSAHPGPQLRTP